MIRRFRGESLHKVDIKGRVSVPAPFRRVLEDGDPEFKVGNNPNFVIVYGGVKTPCLEAYTIKSISIVDQQISKFPRFSREREILENQQEITTLTVIWARQLVSPQPKLTQNKSQQSARVNRAPGPK